MQFSKNLLFSPFLAHQLGYTSEEQWEVFDENFPKLGFTLLPVTLLASAIAVDLHSDQ
jgi:hypothetical protein